MAERLPDRPSEQHPILAGLIALVGVGLAVGVVLGIVVLVGTKVLGLGEDSTAEGTSGRATMYLPEPEETEDAGEPEITLSPEESESPGSTESEETESPSPDESETPEREITLSASTTEVGSMEQFQLTGVYPQGEGAILTVQRFENGAWVDFPATGSVAGEQFQIPVQSSRVGETRFRVVDSDSGLKSDEVTVTVLG